MAIGKTNSCGGDGKLFAVIAVTYPSGSICTCDGKAAQDTSGYALFNVKAGTHTVECHTSDNSQSKSTSVTVADSDAGKVIDVALSYELVLFDNGTYAEETGGWNGKSGNYLVASVSGVASGDEKSASFTSKNSVDLSGYSTIYFTIYSFSGTSEQHNGTLSAGGASLSLGEGSSGTKSFDISKVSSGVIKGTARAWGGGANCTLRVSKVWVN